MTEIAAYPRFQPIKRRTITGRLNFFTTRGEGNPSGGIPAVKETSMAVEKLITYFTKGYSTKTVHKEPISNLNADQAKAVAEFIKKMK